MSAISRRDVLRALLGRRRPDVVIQPSVREQSHDERAYKALILERFCLAHQGGFCSVCVEHCPVEGAVVMDQGKPRIHADLCTGCHACQQACPAPRNAIFLVDAAPRPGMLASVAPWSPPIS